MNGNPLWLPFTGLQLLLSIIGDGSDELHLNSPRQKKYRARHVPITLLPRHMLQVCLLTSPPDPPRRRFYYLAVVLQTLSLCEPLPVKPFSYSLKQVSSLTFDGFRDCQSITEPVYPLLASEGHYLMSWEHWDPAGTAGNLPAFLPSV